MHARKSAVIARSTRALTTSKEGDRLRGHSGGRRVYKLLVEEECEQGADY